LLASASSLSGGVRAFPKLVCARLQGRRVFLSTRATSGPPRCVSQSCRFRLSVPPVLLESRFSCRLIFCAVIQLKPRESWGEMPYVLTSCHSHVAHSAGILATLPSPSSSTKWWTWTFKFCSVAATSPTFLRILPSSLSRLMQLNSPRYFALQMNWVY